MSNDTIAIACDHGAFALKEHLKAYAEEKGLSVLDLGVKTTDSVDYPDYGYAMAGALKDGKASRGILLCGSGIGISIAANRHAHVRAALVHDVTGARLCREHNDANVIVFGGRMIGSDLAEECVDTFLNTDFEGGRHQRRVDKLSNPT
ncbi:ribose 5-phosphate isomerase B [Magnetovibrio sp. PR-2]|uniref:ribose 5-phosphate isomerase B n=1 Tax=Magnetovibrio sp. PR-2 TaxID=3120356 RepID=UPI002FCE1780